MLVPLLIAAAASAHLSAAQQKAVAAVKAQLKDPDSAKFKQLRIDPDGSGCGWVNAKNSYGGYEGFSVFYIGRDMKVVLLSPGLSEPNLCE